jgi:hypothetical protein
LKNLGALRAALIALIVSFLSRFVDEGLKQEGAGENEGLRAAWPRILGLRPY